MSIGKLWESASTFIPEYATKTASCSKAVWSSISDITNRLSQRVHHVAREVLLTSIGWFIPNDLKTNLMMDVEDLEKKSYTLFGYKYIGAFELCSMISALRARLLICEEKKQPEKTGFIAQTHKVLLTSLIWLEGEESSMSLGESVAKISEKIGEVRKQQTAEYSALESTKISIKAQVEKNQGPL